MKRTGKVSSVQQSKSKAYPKVALKKATAAVFSKKKKKTSPITKIATAVTISKKKATNSPVHTKLEAVESVHTKQSTASLPSSKISAVSTPIQKETAITLLSPYRYPIDIHKVVAASARHGGLFFAIMGAVCTLFFANSAFSVQNQLALVTTGNTTSNETQASTPPSSIQCTDPLQYLSASCATQVDTTPDTTFDVDGDRSDLSGNVKVTVNVQHATRVRLMAYHLSTGQNLMLGLMNTTGEDRWEFIWNTQQYQDGVYRLKALIDNGHGSYESVDTTNSTVTNHPLETDTTEPSSDILTTTDDIQNTTTSGVILTADRQRASEEFRFEIQTNGADSIKLYAIEVSTGRQFFLGLAYQAGETIWKYRWNVTTIIEGEYKIIAQPIAQAVSQQTATIIVTKIQKQTLDQSTTTLEVTSDLQPPVDIDIQANFPLAKTAGIKIDVDGANKVVLYAQVKSALQKKFLGLASKVDTNTWIYYFDTIQVPNGEYVLHAEVTNTFGTYSKKTDAFAVLNDILPALSQIETQKIDELSDIYQETQEMIEPTLEEVSANIYASKESARLIKVFEAHIEKAFELLKVALRIEDTQAIEIQKKLITDIQQQVLQTVGNATERASIEEYIRSYFVNRLAALEREMALTQKLIRERTKEEASTDSDNDNITDYDEVNLYKTNPFLADTDNDGFIDGVEILKGYDPTDAKAETLVQYESPLEAGLLQEDILEVHAITTAVVDDPNEVKPIAAILTGKGLPNSFVTLYIFSTPIVVTVKTETDGSWSYRFDGELENGDHTVYVGITDNAGKIVAKSNGFAFVKEAQAYTALDANETAPPVAVVEEESSLLSDSMVYVVLSVSVVAIGLVLILLGIHLDRRQLKLIGDHAEVPV